MTQTGELCECPSIDGLFTLGGVLRQLPTAALPGENNPLLGLSNRLGHQPFVDGIFAG